MTLEREVGRVVTAKMVAERRIKLALKRIATLATMDNPDEMGTARVDIDATVPGVNVVADMRRLPFRDGAFDTVCCDPMYELGNDQRVHLQRELTRVAKTRVLFKAPWIMRATGWQLVETVLMASHTCANVAVLSRLDRIHGDGLFEP